MLQQVQQLLLMHCSQAVAQHHGRALWAKHQLQVSAIVCHQSSQVPVLRSFTLWMNCLQCSSSTAALRAITATLLLPQVQEP